MALPDWSPKVPSWTNETLSLLNDNDAVQFPKQTVQNVIASSKKFPVKFPVDTGRCEFLCNHVSSDILERNINSVYAVVHENVLELYCKFILFKRKHGSTIEKNLYKNMTVKDFVNRLLQKRAVQFTDPFDYYTLLNGKTGYEDWETIGTEKEQFPLILQDCLSYDEIKCSAFLSISSYTYFVNIGDRNNFGKYEVDRSKVEDEGIIIGLIGARLHKFNVMECEELILTEEQNTKENGYGTTTSSSLHKLFSDFYEEQCFTFKEALNHIKIEKKRYTNLRGYCYFDSHYYCKRLLFSFDTLLMEANHRAKLKDTTAYVHVVGLGLGVWKISSHQDEKYMDAFAARIEYLGPKLNNISDICFSYITHEKCGEYKNGDIFPVKNHPLSGIKIHIYRRQPHSKLDGPDKDVLGKLLVVSYAWDGNALPGNEYWDGQIGNSGDSAAASSTQITELHNPHINALVTANNLMVVTSEDVVPFKEYQELIKCRRTRST